MRKILISSLFIATSIIAFSLLAFTGIFFGTDSSKPTELHRAAERNDFVTIRKWIEDGRNLDVTYNEPGNMHSGSGIHGYTALMFAAENRRLEAVKLLVNGGANIYLETSRPQREGYEYSVFDFAVKGGDPETVKFLWEISDKKSFRKRTPTNLRIAYDHFCSRRNKPAARELVVFFLENLTEKHLASEKLLSISYREYCIDAIRFLLDRGVAPTSTAVVAASRSGLPDIVSLYLRHGADINALGSALEANNIYAKVTPLIAAAAEAELKTVTFLLFAGADPNKQDTKGRTALIAAVAKAGCFRVAPRCEEFHEVMKILLKHGARTDIKDRFNKTALDYADLYASDPYIDKKKAILRQRKS